MRDLLVSGQPRTVQSLPCKCSAFSLRAGVHKYLGVGSPGPMWVGAPSPRFRTNHSRAKAVMSNFNRERVLTVHHWTDTLFSFTATRDPSFRFRNGQFTLIGLEVDGRPLLRAYSMVSANYEERLEFFSIKVPDGPLTSRLQHIREGDRILVGKKPVGT